MSYFLWVWQIREAPSASAAAARTATASRRRATATWTSESSFLASSPQVSPGSGPAGPIPAVRYLRFRVAVYAICLLACSRYHAPCPRLLSRFLLSYSHPPTPVNLRGVCRNWWVRLLSGRRLWSLRSYDQGTSHLCKRMFVNQQAYFFELCVRSSLMVYACFHHCTPRHSHDRDSWE